jgi:hypothetical protein
MHRSEGFIDIPQFNFHGFLNSSLVSKGGRQVITPAFPQC